jgi:hypothetical protein
LNFADTRSLELDYNALMVFLLRGVSSTTVSRVEIRAGAARGYL